MKSSDIKVGETYGYLTYGNPGSTSLADRSVHPITVKAVRPEIVRNRTTYGSRRTTVVVGARKDGTEFSVLPAKVLAPWAEVVEARKDLAERVAKSAEYSAQVRTELDQKLVRLERLVAGKIEPRNDYLGVYYVNRETGETAPNVPHDERFKDDSPWEYHNASTPVLFDRQDILRRGTVTLKVDELLALLEG